MDYEATMPELSTADRSRMAWMNSIMMHLLLLDDAWTEIARRPVPPDAGFPFPLIESMDPLLRQMGDVADFIGGLSERMGDGLQARFDALMWGEGLSTTDRDDLRWLVTGHVPAVRLPSHHAGDHVAAAIPA